MRAKTRSRATTSPQVICMIAASRNCVLPSGSRSIRAAIRPCRYSASWWAVTAWLLALAGSLMSPSRGCDRAVAGQRMLGSAGAWGADAGLADLGEQADAELGEDRRDIPAVDVAL